MGWLDPIPRAGHLYIGGLYALYQGSLLQTHNITHVLSVIDYDPGLSSKPELAKLGLKTLWIDAPDDPDTDLLCWFERTGQFIREGLEGGGGVFVHCAMGKSRSAAVVVAWLVERWGVGWTEGLRWLEEGRPVCDPNPGFKEQLAVWERMVGEKDAAKRKGMYDEWERTRFRGSWWEWEKRVEAQKTEAKAKL